MKTKILFLIALLVGFNPPARSDGEHVNVSKTICDLAKVIDDCVKEEIVLDDRKNDETGNCGTQWSGINFVETRATENKIIVHWQNSKSYSNDIQPTYKVFYATGLYWSTKQVNNDGEAPSSFTINGLQPSTSYFVKVERTCSGTKKMSQTITITTDDSGSGNDDSGDDSDDAGSGELTVDCNTPTELSVISVTPYSAEVRFAQFNTSSNLEYEWTFFNIHGGKRADPHTHVGKAYNASPSWKAPPYPQTTTLTGLSPNTDYHFWVEKRCQTKGAYSGQGLKRVVLSKSIDFTTGSVNSNDPCACLSGSTSLPHLLGGSGGGPIFFYCGDIRSTDKVKGSSGEIVYKASVVELNPGFETNITGSGRFIAVAFNASGDCQGDVSGPIGNPNDNNPDSGGGPIGNPNNGIPPNNGGGVFGKAEEVSAGNRQTVPKKYIVYPNPNRGSFSIDFREKDVVIKSITVYDMFGVRILYKRYNRRLDVEQYSLRLVKSGLYKIAIRTANGVEYETLLVEF